MNGDMMTLVEGVVVDGMLVDKVFGDIVVDVLFVRGGRLVITELPEWKDQKQGQHYQEGDPPAARRLDHRRLSGVENGIGTIRREERGIDE